ncbi:MAG: hypothetical protein KBC43_07245 [Bacteroidales bacterium]|nr:hypothetical protein [Bacteroidales bacterium]
MKTLQLKMRKNGFEYIQLLRGQRSCVYEQVVSENVSYYEVFILKIQPARKVGDRVLGARELFPHNEAFGDWAWSFRDLNEAKLKFNEIEKGGML